MPHLFALSDLHLSFARPKPMDVFGPAWADHAARVDAAWRADVSDDDIVLIAGDTSWAMKLEDAAADLAWIASLPGEKVFVKGNHDYWWSSIGKVRKAAPPGLHFIQNDALRLGPLAVGGSRLWDFPDVSWPQALVALEETLGEAKAADVKANRHETDDEKIRAREIDRLRLSLSQLDDDAPLRVALVHYPPVGSDGKPTALTRLMTEYNIDLCVYGHLHSLGNDPRPGAECEIDGTRYVLTACDWLDGRPVRLASLDDKGA